MRKFYILIFVLLTFAQESFSQVYPRPIAAFQPIQITNWCKAGNLSLNWSYCSVRNESNFHEWRFVDAYINMGDGNTKYIDNFEKGLIEHKYNMFGSVSISGTANFINNEGVQVSTPIVWIDGVNNSFDLCNIINDSTAVFLNSLSIEVYNIQPLFSTVTNNNVVEFYNESTTYPSSGNSSNWNFDLYIDGNLKHSGSGLPTTGSSFYQTTLPHGQYKAELVYYQGVIDQGYLCFRKFDRLIQINFKDTCENCHTFKPTVGKRYWVSAWVKEDHSSQVKSYKNAKLSIDFVGNAGLFTFHTTGDIVEGWQRIVGSFVIPNGTTHLNINLVSSELETTYFDDVRIHPFNASMKSYVYDPETLLLSAELDDNNYSTFYEYDKEGKLIRIKKETARGIMTIQESRSSNTKKDQ